MKELILIFVNTICASVGGFLFFIFSFDIFQQDGKLSLWIWLASAGMGAVCFWKLSDLILKKISPKQS